jgi:prepilin-type N-terminal cleavage/methylation domain-containing protein
MSRRIKGFTLVELLVVIGIIALLISILLPVLGRVREQGNRVKCMSNHRTLGQTMIMYANDNKQFLPFCNWGPTDTVRNPGWLYDGAVPLTAGRRVPDDLKTGSFWKYLKSPEVFRCPNDLPPYDRGPVNSEIVHTLTSYGMNGSINNFGNNWPSGSALYFRISQFKAQDIAIWEIDEWSGSGFWFNDGANFPTEGLSKRHGKYSGPQDKSAAAISGGGGIITTFGGNVEWMTLADYNKELTPAGVRSRLWNVPASRSPGGGH